MKKKFNDIKRLTEFDKDFKKLLKKYRSLEEDLDAFIDNQLVLYHKLNVDNNGIFQIPNLGFEEPKIYKAKKFACKALKGKGVQSGIRIVYAHYPDEDMLEFIEIYHKSDKENEDRERIRRYYAKN
ncbi:MAG: hypothetical protein H6755_06430 [Candidatus Omnitrophica bacterium]|nr:hypothetical protein [Candidatus Omnitrophota bacterium]MCB9748024.1 hypothetical protein [Candidatus Omnitrophota bacterium]